jgi:hypothetical protein
MTRNNPNPVRCTMYSPAIGRTAPIMAAQYDAIARRLARFAVAQQDERKGEDLDVTR